MRITLIAAALLAAARARTGGAPDLAPIDPFECDADLTPAGPIDELVFQRLEAQGIEPARLCSDAVFVRRVYLDTLGTLPAAREAREFLEDRDPNKRGALIDRLLEREEFAAYRALRWSDLLRVKSEFPVNLWPNGVQAYYRWIRTSLREGMPYDRFARELLTASGSNFRVPQVNFYRAVPGRDARAIAGAVALTFLGVRAKDLTEEQLSGLAAFFRYVAYKPTEEWKEEIVFHDSVRAERELAAGGSRTAVFPDGTRVKLSAARDPRGVFADWLLAPGNPWFTRNIANRIWYWLQGRGIIHEPDAIHPGNPPRNPELLAFLEEELVKSRYDLEHLYRLILNSKAYQLSSIPRSRSPAAEALFAFYPLRQLEAEVLIDAICQITGTTERYSSAIPEPYTFIPEDQRSIALADGSITSAFLELFGRPPRDTGLLAERANRPTAAQRLHLLNSSHIRNKIEQSQKLRGLIESTRDPERAARELYLTILSRLPTAGELEALREHRQSGAARGREAAVDLVWALLNTTEFLYRH